MKQKRKRKSARQFHSIPYTLIGFGLIIIIFILGFVIGATITGLANHLSNQALIDEWNAYATQTTSYKATHDPILQVTQTVSEIKTQWAEINITQTSVILEQEG